jgi:hypothetical protein
MIQKGGGGKKTCLGRPTEEGEGKKNLSVFRARSSPYEMSARSRSIGMRLCEAATAGNLVELQ